MAHVAEPDEVYTTRDALDILSDDRPQPEEIWGGLQLVPGQIMEVIGGSGLGKSRIVLNLALNQVLGRPFAGLPTLQRPLTWLFYGNENSFYRFRHDLSRMTSVLNTAECERLRGHVWLPTMEKAADAFVSFSDPANRERLKATMRLRKPDVLVLDLMMPRKSGFDVCEEIRKKDVALPILVVTAKGDESDKVLAFGLGVDDYLVKPFSMKELELRIAAILRRQRVGETTSRIRNRFAFASHNVDADRFVLTDKDGNETRLTSLELGILRLLSAHPGEVISRERFINELWGVSYYGTQRTLDTRVSALRQKLGADGELIASVRSVGYRLVTRDSGQ